MPAPSASQQKAQANEVANVLQIDSKTAAKLLAKSGWSTSVAINGYVQTSLSWGTFGSHERGGQTVAKKMDHKWNMHGE
jgi:hypothetical protein